MKNLYIRIESGEIKIAKTQERIKKKLTEHNRT